jgi:hypothetical protein
MADELRRFSNAHGTFDAAMQLLDQGSCAFNDM